MHKWNIFVSFKMILSFADVSQLLGSSSAQKVATVFSPFVANLTLNSFVRLNRQSRNVCRRGCPLLSLFRLIVDRSQLRFLGSSEEHGVCVCVCVSLRT